MKQDGTFLQFGGLKLFFQRLALGCLLYGLSVTVLSQEAPQLVSVTPVEGATGVATDASLVFVFSEDMNTTTVPFGSIPGAAVGNFEILLPSVFFTGSWGADKRTLTITAVGALPFETEVNWTLNPPGEPLFPKFSSAAGVQLEMISGSFRTTENLAAGPAPIIESVTPSIGATGVMPNAELTIAFDMAMDTSVIPTSSFLPAFVGNYSMLPASISSQFQGSWSADGRALTIKPFGNIAANTTVAWTLNPAGTSNPLKSAAGRPLAMTNGTYQVVANTGGNTNEICSMGSTNLALGSYSMFKSYTYDQNSAAGPVPAMSIPYVFSTSVHSPPGAVQPVATASITLADGTEHDLTNRFGTFNYFETRATEAEFDADLAAGPYVLRFAPAGGGGDAITMEMPEPLATIPTIENYNEAQAIDATESFTLRWLPWESIPSGAYIILTINDVFGNMMFLAPNPCIPRELTPSDTSVEIPANYLKPGQRYNASLVFGENFYFNTNLVQEMIGTGLNIRTTSFTIETAGGETGGPTVLPARFLDHGMIGLQPRMTLTGTPGHSYTIERADTATQAEWVVAGTVTMDESGEAEFEETVSPLQFPIFYRAVTEP